MALLRSLVVIAVFPQAGVGFPSAYVPFDTLALCSLGLRVVRHVGVGFPPPRRRSTRWCWVPSALASLDPLALGSLCLGRDVGCGRVPVMGGWSMWRGGIVVVVVDMGSSSSWHHGCRGGVVVVKVGSWSSRWGRSSSMWHHGRRGGFMGSRRGAVVVELGSWASRWSGGSRGGSEGSWAARRRIALVVVGFPMLAWFCPRRRVARHVAVGLRHWRWGRHSGDG